MSARDSMAVCEREIRGVPIWVVREYLEQLGGQSKVDGWLQGPGWKARLTPMEDYQIGSLHVSQTRLKLQGDAKAVAEVRDTLEKRLLRAGG